MKGELEEQEGTSTLPIFIYLVILFLLLYFIWINKCGKHSKYQLPPSPWKLPIIGNLHQLRDPAHHAFRCLAQKHGPLMLLNLGRVPTLVVSSAIMAQEILKKHDHVILSRPIMSIPARLLYGKDLAFVPYGEYWRQIRKVCVLQLLSVKKVQSFGVIREEETLLMMEKINHLSSCSFSVNLSEMFVSIANNVICRAALGRKYGEEENGRRFKEIIQEFEYLLGTFNVGDYVPSLAWLNKLSGLNARLENTFHELDSFLDGVVEEHIHKTNSRDGDGDGDGYGGNQTADFVDVLLGVEKDSTLGIPFTRTNIKAIVLDMFAAGTDTTSVFLEWAMSELLKNPKIMMKVQKEVRQIGRGKPVLTEDDNIESMQYLKLVIKETLRLHPPIPLLVPRESSEKMKIQGYDIPAKTTIIFNAYAIGRDRMSWEDPEKFWPERFVSDGASQIDFKGQDFELIPFGSGRRGCPGVNFSLALIELVLANLLNMFDWGLLNGMEGKDLDMRESTGLSSRRKIDLLVAAKAHYS